MALGKKELAERLAKRMEVPKAQAERLVDGFVDQITESLAQGEEVNITGFGKFMVQHREARQGRNPQTGQPVQIAAKKVPKFSAGKSLKDSVS